MTDDATEVLEGQQELFPVKHQAWQGTPRCGDCGRFLRAGLPCTNTRCYGDGAYSHIPAMAITAAANIIDLGTDYSRDTAAEMLAAAWPHIIATINPPTGAHT